MKKLPSTDAKKHPLFGDVIHLAKDPLNFLSEQREKMGDVYQLSSLFGKVAIVNHPDLVDYILRLNSKNYVKSKGYETLKVLLGEGLLTSEGDFWRSQRRLMQPAFYKEKLSHIVEVMLKQTEDFFNEWQQNYPVGAIIDVSAEMNKIALRVVAKSLFESEIGDDVTKMNENLPFVLEKSSVRILKPTQLPRWIPTPENRKEQNSIRQIEKVVYKIIENRRKSKEEHQDLLSLLMNSKDEETGRFMDDEQLRDEVMTIFLAGHETSANALAYFLYLMDKNPEVFKKLKEEVDQVTGGESIKARHLHNMKYMQQCINETLRLYPPAWIIGRRPLEDDQLGEYQLPKTYQALICTYTMHRNPKYWEKPEEFNPERFSEENIKKIPKGAYMPFGGGARLCIGNNFAMYEMQIVIANLLKSFELKLKENYQLDLVAHITMRPKNPILMKRIA